MADDTKPEFHIETPSFELNLRGESETLLEAYDAMREVVLEEFQSAMTSSRPSKESTSTNPEPSDSEGRSRRDDVNKADEPSVLEGETSGEIGDSRETSGRNTRPMIASLSKKTSRKDTPEQIEGSDDEH